MDIRCPHCATDYVLPETLLGPGGARVRCPSCQGAFAVAADGAVRAGEAPPTRAHPTDPAPAPDPGSREERIARSVLDELEVRSGPDIAAAAARGRAFAECGPQIMEAWDEYRSRAGRGADPAPFRDALRSRWGIDLPAGEGR
jgi:predicted Zn finger-like uncharacterized protein